MLVQVNLAVLDPCSACLLKKTVRFVFCLQQWRLATLTLLFAATTPRHRGRITPFVSYQVLQASGTLYQQVRP